MKLSTCVIGSRSLGLVALLFLGCSKEPSNLAGTGGAAAASGGAASGPGGTTATGGAVAQGGQGGMNAATGGAVAQGGTNAATGGAVAQGGTNAATGGAVAQGGTNAATGGAVAQGGTVGVGGNSSGGAGNVVVGGPRWVGRVDASNPDAAKFAWSGSGLVAIVSGATISVKLRTESTPTVYFQPVIDGTPGARFKVDSGSDQTVMLASGLSAADHLIELYRETEGYYGLSTFLGFTSGSVKGAPAASGRLIEVVGDSISAGYGNLGSEPHPNWVATPACHWTAENSSWYATYATVAGHSLNAEVSTIARSGWGMYRDLDGNTTGVLSSVYDNALGMGTAGAWSFAPKASVVVINLGTNDWAKGDPGVPYETAYVNFVTKVRSHYPDAWIFLTIGSMTGDPQLTQVKTRLGNVITASGDQKLATFDFGTQNMGSDGTVPTGCDWHPNVADHQRMAGILKQQLSAKLGW